MSVCLEPENIILVIKTGQSIYYVYIKATFLVLKWQCLMHQICRWQLTVMGCLFPFL